MDKRKHFTKSNYKLYICNSDDWTSTVKANEYLCHVDEVGFDTSLTFSMAADFNKKNYIQYIIYWRTCLFKVQIYTYKRKYSVVQNKQKRKKNNRLQLRHWNGVRLVIHPVKRVLTNAQMYTDEWLRANHPSPKKKQNTFFKYLQKQMNLTTTKCNCPKAKQRDQSRCVEIVCIIINYIKLDCNLRIFSLVRNRLS